MRLYFIQKFTFSNASYWNIAKRKILIKENHIFLKFISYNTFMQNDAFHPRKIISIKNFDVFFRIIVSKIRNLVKLVSCSHHKTFFYIINYINLIFHIIFFKIPFNRKPRSDYHKYFRKNRIVAPLNEQYGIKMYNCYF